MNQYTTRANIEFRERADARLREIADRWIAEGRPLIASHIAAEAMVSECYGRDALRRLGYLPAAKPIRPAEPPPTVEYQRQLMACYRYLGRTRREGGGEFHWSSSVRHPTVYRTPGRAG